MIRFQVGDLVRVSDNAEFARGAEGSILTIEYLPENSDSGGGEYMVEFDIPVHNPHFLGNEDWEQPEYTEAYFNDNELEPRDRVPKKRISGFGKWINKVEDNA